RVDERPTRPAAGERDPPPPPDKLLRSRAQRHLAYQPHLPAIQHSSSERRSLLHRPRPPKGGTPVESAVRGADVVICPTTAKRAGDSSLRPEGRRGARSRPHAPASARGPSRAASSRAT